MARQTIKDLLRKRIAEQYRDWRERIALKSGVDAKEVEKLLDADDETVVRALIDIMQRRGEAKVITTLSSYRFISSLFNTALHETRRYAISAPTGIGKTFTVTNLKNELDEGQEGQSRVGYLYVSEYGNRKTSIMNDVAEAFGFATAEGGLGGRRAYKQLVNFFREREGYLLIIDEAQRLDYGAIEALRCLMDQTALSMLFLGSDEFAERFKNKKKLAGEQYGQFIRRVEWNTSASHATPGDVKNYLEAYAIDVTKKEATMIAQRIAERGDFATLYAAICMIGKNTRNEDMTWKGIGAGRILEAVDIVIAMYRGGKIKDSTMEKEAA
jgi:DNA transposition AAA+ family ATPase